MKTLLPFALASGMVLSAATSGAAAAAAAAADSYAVVSLVGDSFTIVDYQVATGSNIDRNTHQEVPLGDGPLDRMATRVTLNAIRRALPDATVQQIDVPDRAAFANAADLSASDAPLGSLLSAVKPLLTQPDTRYLVVITKFRSDAHLRAGDGSLGGGKLTGLGFYVDPYRRMRRANTGETGRGFVAPFAYVRVSLVDLRTGTVVRSESDEETTTRANVGPDASLDPWTSLTAEQKLRLLENQLGRALQKTVPHVVAPA